MSGVIESLKDAPVMNLFVLVGFMLVVLAAIGRVKSWKVDAFGRALSGVCGIGLLGAATVMFLGLRQARAMPPQDETPPHGGQTTNEPLSAPGPAAPAPPPVAASPSPPHLAAGGEPTGSDAGASIKKLKKHPSVKTTTLAAHPAPAPTPLAEAPSTVTAAPRRETVLPPKDQYGDWGCEETKTIRASLALPEGAEFRSAVVDVVGIDNAKSFRKLEPTFDPATRTVTAAVEFRGLDRVFFNCPGGGHATVRLSVKAAVP